MQGRNVRVRGLQAGRVPQMNNNLTASLRVFLSLNPTVTSHTWGCRWGVGPAGAHLTADHNVGDFGLAVTAVRLVISGADRQDEVARMTLTLSHQEAAVLALLRQQLLSLPARQVAVEPSGEKGVVFIPTIRGDTGIHVELKTSKYIILYDLIWSDACKLFPFSKYNWVTKAFHHCALVWPE